jgi:hypothetical protein
MGYYDVLDGIAWIDEHFHLILPPPDEMPSIDYILEKARAAVLRWVGVAAAHGSDTRVLCVQRTVPVS